MEKERVQKQLKAISDPTRWMIFQMLIGKSLCGCQLLSDLSITQPTLSHHMKVLMDVGLVHSFRKGTWSHYSLNLDSIRMISAFFDSSLIELSEKRDASCDCPR